MDYYNYSCWPAPHLVQILPILDKQHLEVIRGRFLWAAQFQTLEASLHGNDWLKDQSKESWSRMEK